jgi:hypothetical protein
MTIGDAQKTGKSHLYCANPTVSHQIGLRRLTIAPNEKKNYTKYNQNITDTENSGRIAF